MVLQRTPSAKGDRPNSVFGLVERALPEVPLAMKNAR